MFLPSACKVQRESWDLWSGKYLFQGQGSPCEPEDSLSIEVFSSFYRATAWVEKPICVFPAEKIALGELLTAGYLTTQFKMKTFFGFSWLSSLEDCFFIIWVIIHSPSTAVRQSGPRPKFESQPLFRALTSLGSFLTCTHTFTLYLWDLYLQATNWHLQLVRFVFVFTGYVFDLTYPTETMSISFLFFW